MANGIDFGGLTFGDVADLVEIRNNNIKQIEAAIGKQTAKALEAIGLQAENYAKKACPVDTGRLRNSITHNLDLGSDAVLIGTNVEYAPYVEGDDRKAHTNGKAHFLRDAAALHESTYKTILSRYLSGK